MKDIADKVEGFEGRRGSNGEHTYLTIFSGIFVGTVRPTRMLKLDLHSLGMSRAPGYLQPRAKRIEPCEYQAHPDFHVVLDSWSSVSNQRGKQILLQVQTLCYVNHAIVTPSVHYLCKPVINLLSMWDMSIHDASSSF